MKKLLTLILLMSQLSYAGGYFCNALCVSLDSADSTLYVLGEVEIEIGVAKRWDAHYHLKSKCRNMAWEYYVPGGPILVDYLDFSSKTSSSGRSSRKENSRYYHRLRGIHYYSSRERSYYKKNSSLSIYLEPSDMHKSCHYDRDIRFGRIPYVGTIK